jgi:hypothetical protein
MPFMQCGGSDSHLRDYDELSPNLLPGTMAARWCPAVVREWWHGMFPRYGHPVN